MRIGRVVVLLLVAIFCLTTPLALAAGDSWVVIKDKSGVCKVIKAKEKTPATIAGPFASKDEAKKAKERECPKAAKPGKPGKPTTSQ